MNPEADTLEFVECAGTILAGLDAPDGGALSVEVLARTRECETLVWCTDADGTRRPFVTILAPPIPAAARLILHTVQQFDDDTRDGLAIWLSTGGRLGAEIGRDAVTVQLAYADGRREELETYPIRRSLQ